VAVSDKGEVRAWGSFRVSLFGPSTCYCGSTDDPTQSSDGVLGFDGVPGHSPFQFTPIALHSLQKAKVQVVQISCGSDFVLALTTTGHVYGWGDGEQQQLGRRIMGRRRLNGLEPERLGLRNIVSVSTGMYHSFAIDTNGIVWAWGLNTFHQTGVSSSKGGDEDMVTVPAQVDALHPDKHNGGKVIRIQGGEHHSIFLFDNGEVWACGRSDAHQIGISDEHPAFEGIRERREDAMGVKNKKVEAAQKKVDALKGDEDEEVKDEVNRELAAAQANLAAALDEYVPEPVRVGHNVFGNWYKLMASGCRYTSRLFPSRTPRHLLFRLLVNQQITP
jgi:regulator of chromosome condensation